MASISKENYFDLFGLDFNFEINADMLEKKYFELQRQYHPDKMAGKEEGEKIKFLHKSAIINDAYKTLKTPLNRAEYMLFLSGRIVNDENNTEKPDQKILIESMKQREQLSYAATAKETDKIKKENEKKKDLCIKKLRDAFNKKEEDVAVKLTIRLKYLNKLSEEIRIKQKGINNAD